jgi:hypothetical protein
MFGGMNLHIHGDLFLILGNTPINGLVWNWKTGELVAKIASAPPPHTSFRHPSGRTKLILFFFFLIDALSL